MPYTDPERAKEYHRQYVHKYRESHNARARAWYAANKDHIKSRSTEWSRNHRERAHTSKYKYRYGIQSIEEVRQLKTNPCEICGLVKKRMVIDHKIHGTYRGILCHQCNTQLGWYENKKVKIHEYVQKGIN